MTDETAAELAEQVRSRDAEAARAILQPKGEPESSCGSSCCGTPDEAPTTQAAPGMHAAIIRAVKPAAA